MDYGNTPILEVQDSDKSDSEFDRLSEEHNLLQTPTQGWTSFQVQPQGKVGQEVPLMQLPQGIFRRQYISEAIELPVDEIADSKNKVVSSYKKK